MENLKLSTLIREGIALDGPQIKKKYFSVDENGKITGCCAYGAAMIAYTKRLRRDHTQSFAILDSPMLADVLGISQVTVNPPVGLNILNNSLVQIIYHLNDRAGWTREQIADWVESVGY